MLEPIRDIPCNYECGDGQYLEINTRERTFGCKNCPENTYSNGGGISIDGYMSEWEFDYRDGMKILNKQKLEIRSSCATWFGWDWLYFMDCQPCEGTLIRDSLECGVSTVTNSAVAFITEMTVEFEKDGKIEFLYKKDTAHDDQNEVSGILSV